MTRPSAILLTLAIAASAHAETVRDFVSSPDPKLVVTVDSVDYRADLTRVYGKISGRPHTSGRIDDVTLTAGDAVLPATDIDGVDFGRYFQWEESGVLPLELDFPPVKDHSGGILTIATPRGSATTHFKK